jgi:L-lactate dehydrogenase complex protein LldE
MVEPFDKVKTLLGSLEGITLVEPARLDECCGFGGTFAVTEEAMSCMMGTDRLADQAQAGAEVITGVDMSCLMHLEGLARRQRRDVKILHVAQVLLGEAA